MLSEDWFTDNSHIFIFAEFSVLCMYSKTVKYIKTKCITIYPIESIKSVGIFLLISTHARSTWLLWLSYKDRKWNACIYALHVLVIVEPSTHEEYFGICMRANCV